MCSIPLVQPSVWWLKCATSGVTSYASPHHHHHLNPAAGKWNTSLTCPELQEVLDLLGSGFFNPEELDIHTETVRYVRQDDPYCICADFDSYVAIQKEAARIWRQPEVWWPMVVRNIAHSGRFSSDRTISEYASEIWGLSPVPITLND